MTNKKDSTTNQDNSSDFTEPNGCITGKTPKTSMLAVLAFTLGIASVVSPVLLFVNNFFEQAIFLIILLSSIITLALAFIALSVIKKSMGNLKGKKLAIAAIVIPFLWLLILCLCFCFSRVTNPPHPEYNVRQKAQFNGIQVALEFFVSQFKGYPPSDDLDSTGKPYCGAMKLCEAMMGKDLLGFNKISVFRSDGMDATGSMQLYPKAKEAYNLKLREGPFLPPDHSDTYQLREIYEDVGPFDGNNCVICDAYPKKRYSGKLRGMPILYYKADTSKTAHDVNDPNNPENIYNYKDNYALLALGVPGEPGKKHPLFEDPKIFYEMTRDYQVVTQSKPNRPDSFILLSAGKDGLYGTKDDVVNFDIAAWKRK